MIYVDHFGNLMTNVAAALALPSRRAFRLRIGGARIRGVAPSYAAAAPGALVAVVNSWDLLEIAVRDGSARERLGVGVGAPVTLDDA